MLRIASVSLSRTTRYLRNSLLAQRVAQKESGGAKTFELASLVDVRTIVRVDVVLVTATQVELTAVLGRLLPLEGHNHLFKVHEKSTYYIGRLGTHTAALVMGSMGSTGQNSATLVTYDAIQLWLPKAVIMPGIAFGRSKVKQRPCDVLVSERVIPYGPKRVAKRVIHRGSPICSSLVLLDRFRNAVNWSFEGPNGRCKVREGALLSGDELVNDERRKRQLFTAFSAAIGGEMEGAGVSSAAQRAGTPWILVKAICDWADGNKTDEYQARAAEASVSLVEHVLSDVTALAELEYTRPAVHSIPVEAPRVDQATPALAESLDAIRTSGTLTSLAEALRKPPLTRPRRLLPSILSEAQSRLLRMVASSPIPLDQRSYTALFPKEHWGLTRDLKRKHLLAVNRNGGLAVPARIRAHLFKDATLKEQSERVWLRRLETLRNHPDTAVLLALMYVRMDRLEDSVAVLASASQELEPGYWNDFLRDLIMPLTNPRILARLSDALAADLLNAAGMCLIRSSEHIRATQTFDRLEQLAQRTRLPLYEAYSNINRGIACYHLRRFDEGQQFYQRTIKIADRIRDRQLRGRALHNLGMMLLEIDPDAGVRYLNDSLQLKLSTGDVLGAAGTLLGQGNYYAKRKQHAKAIEMYREALKLAEKFKYISLAAMALMNIGSSLSELGLLNDSFQFYREASGIAESEHFSEILRLSVQGEAVTRLKAGDVSRARELFARLVELSVTTKERLRAKHDLAVAMWRSGQPGPARRTLLHVRREAEAEGLENSEYAAITTKAYIAAESSGADVQSQLLREAFALRKKGRCKLAGRLLEAVAQKQYESGAPLPMAEATLALAEQAYAHAGLQDYTIRTLTTRYAWLRDRGAIEAAYAFGRKMEKILRVAGRRDELVKLFDEQGNRLQQLGRFKDAERAHRKALAQAKRLPGADLLESPLNNLGLLLQRTGRPAESLVFFERSIRLARRRYDVDAEALSSLNRALALVDLKRFDDARQVLEYWKDHARQLALWTPFVRALHTLANISVLEKRWGLAAKQYHEALREAEARNVNDTAVEIAMNYTLLSLQQLLSWDLRRRHREATRTYIEARELAERYRLIERIFELDLAMSAHMLTKQGRIEDQDLRLLLRALAGADESNRIPLAAAISLRLLVAASSEDPRRWTKRIARAKRWVVKEFSKDLHGVLHWPLETGWKAILARVNGRRVGSKALLEVARLEAEHGLQSAADPAVAS